MLVNNWEYKGIKVKFTFYDGQDEKDFEPYTQSYAICFRDDGKIMIGFTPSAYNDWLIPGGKREKGEDGLKTLYRELDEELSLDVRKHYLIGAQKVDYLNVKKKSHYQLRYAAIVKVKKLTPDPDNGLMWKRKAIDPKDFSKYLPWGNIGEHMIKEAVKWFKKEIKKEKLFAKKIVNWPYRQGIQAYIVNEKDELLLVSNASDANFWKAPSGGIEKGESCEEAVKREMREELGVDINIIKKMTFKNRYVWTHDLIQKLCEKYPGQTYRGQEQVPFLVRIKKGSKIKIDPNEISEYRWVKFDRINELLKLKHQQKIAAKVIA